MHAWQGKALLVERLPSGHTHFGKLQTASALLPHPRSLGEGSRCRHSGCFELTVSQCFLPAVPTHFGSCIKGGHEHVMSRIIVQLIHGSRSPIAAAALAAARPTAFGPALSQQNLEPKYSSTFIIWTSHFVLRKLCNRDNCRSEVRGRPTRASLICKQCSLRSWLHMRKFCKLL